MEPLRRRLLARRAHIFNLKPQITPFRSQLSQQRAFKSDDRLFFAQTSSWARRSGLTILRRTYHSNPEFAYRGYINANRVVWTMIGLNTAVFGAWQIAEMTKNRDLYAKLSKHAVLSQGNLDAGRYYTFITSAFSHKEPFHFIFNMMAFSAFGRIISAFGVGGAHMTLLALGSAILGSYAMHVQRAPKEGFRKTSSEIWQRLGNGNALHAEIWQALGASGMVMGMGAAATLLAPMTRMIVFVVPAPLFLVTAGYAAADTYFLGSKTSRIGHAAHLGGLAFGAVYYFVSLRRFGGVWQFARRALRR